jgi:hypothetical protein
MTKDEALEIVELFEKWADSSCTCHLGHPPCPKCTEQPTKEDYEWALLTLNNLTKFRIVREGEYTVVKCTDEPSQGGACHSYIIDAKTNSKLIPSYIVFQNGPIQEHGVNGCQNEDLIATVIDRLEGFQSGNFACEENANALECLRMALSHLERRTVARKARGVEGRNIR